MTSTTVTYTGCWSPEDRESSVYQYVPFDVASGVSTIEVRLSYDRSEAAVLDLGLFGPTGFRGYSGGARDRFLLTPTAATPGYLPGEPVSGEWNALLGLYVVPPGGVDWEVEVSTNTGMVDPPPSQPAPDPAPRPPGRSLPSESGGRWLAGDLHAHTFHSDGVFTIDELANLARESGLDFLAVTDHNTVSHHPWLAEATARYGVHLLPGQEVTTADGHANCLGDLDWIDFRQPPDEWLAQADASEGLLSINHPVFPGLDWRHPLDRDPHLVELWHWTWDGRSEEPIRWWEDRGGVPVGGSDFHSPHQGRRLGEPTTFVEVLDHDLLAGLRAGRVAVAASPQGPAMVRVGDDIVVVDGEGLMVIGPEGRETTVRGATFSTTGEDGLHRLVDRDSRTLAMTI